MKILVLLLLFITSSVTAATIDIYQFKTPQQQARFDGLTQEFRCLVCQNEALADSTAPLAQDLRKQIAGLVQQGVSDQDIKHFLVQRYGNFVLFSPPLEAATWLLWCGPFVLLLVGFGAIIYFVKGKNKI